MEKKSSIKNNEKGDLTNFLAIESKNASRRDSGKCKRYFINLIKNYLIIIFSVEQ
jgi:hypothetical protein